MNNYKAIHELVDMLKDELDVFLDKNNLHDLIFLVLLHIHDSLIGLEFSEINPAKQAVKVMPQTQSMTEAEKEKFMWEVYLLERMLLYFDFTPCAHATLMKNLLPTALTCLGETEFDFDLFEQKLKEVVT